MSPIGELYVFCEPVVSEEGVRVVRQCRVQGEQFGIRVYYWRFVTFVL